MKCQFGGEMMLVECNFAAAGEMMMNLRRLLNMVMWRLLVVIHF